MLLQSSRIGFPDKKGPNPVLCHRNSFSTGKVANFGETGRSAARMASD